MERISSGAFRGPLPSRLYSSGAPGRDGQKPTKGVVQRVNEKRAAEGKMLLPERVTPHTLRRTFASLCFFAGRDLRWVMGQLGHADPRMTLAVYAQAMKRSRVDEQLVWQLMRLPWEPEESPGFRTANRTTSREVLSDAPARMGL